MGKGSKFLRFTLFLVLGFLPSFLFVTLLLQHGSLLQNYLNFLKDFKSSWWAYICAAAIIVVCYLFSGFVRYMKNPQNKTFKKVALLTLFFIIAVIGIIALTQTYFYGRFLIGNDLLIKLSADKNDLFFSHDEAKDINFKISASMNPICTAECRYEFLDLSSGVITDSGSFNLTPLFSKTQTYFLKGLRTNESQRLSLFNVRCKAQKARLCYTKGEEVKRSVLITLNYASSQDPGICCLNGTCERCCDANCSGKNYPVIFLHGHSVNRALPADYSLDKLAKIKDKLVQEGYVDAGIMVTNYEREDPGLWGRVNAPVAVTASYFFDIYKTESGEETTVPSKTESIDTYAIRLRDIIDAVKHRTGKDKVIIVAHSMGGLVTRRYVQIFGDSNIKKVIFITIPNHGIDGKVRDYCSLLGDGSTCSDMDKDSIFINRLDNSPQPAFPIENIIGFGCTMGEETGDGIVKNSSQFLSFANNHYIQGACNELGLEFLHEEITDIDKYPEVYEIVNETVRN